MKPLTQLLINCVREDSTYNKIRMSLDPILAALEIASQEGLDVSRQEIESYIDPPRTSGERLEALSICRFNWIRVVGMLACGSGDGVSNA
jgi:hypothetical protein